MAENSGIQWTDHTFNPWIGCSKVGPGCDHCYAEDLAACRLGVTWGVGQPRRRTAPSTWKQPYAWNRKAVKEGRRYRVFSASLADIFDNEVDPAWRADFWGVVRATPYLDWIIVTKRIGNAAKMLPADWGNGYPNVTLLITVVDQREADRDIPKLLALPAAKRGLSIEPMLGPVDLSEWLSYDWSWDSMRSYSFGECHPKGDRNRYFQNDFGERCAFDGFELAGNAPLDWVIVGGESGPSARPMHPAWVRSLRDQCAAAVPFFFKQWGEWLPGSQYTDQGPLSRFRVAEWDSDGTYTDGHRPGWIYDMLDMSDMDSDLMYRVGRKAAGRRLDGVEHNGWPE